MGVSAFSEKGSERPPETVSQAWTRANLTYICAFQLISTLFNPCGEINMFLQQLARNRGNKNKYFHLKYM